METRIQKTGSGECLTDGQRQRLDPRHPVWFLFYFSLLVNFHDGDMTPFLQSWASTFWSSRLRFCALGRDPFALIWILNFALLHSRFRPPTLFDFSRSYFRAPLFLFFVLLDFRARVSIFIYGQARTARTGQAEEDRQRRTGNISLGRIRTGSIG